MEQVLARLGHLEQSMAYLQEREKMRVEAAALDICKASRIKAWFDYHTIVRDGVNEKYRHDESGTLEQNSDEALALTIEKLGKLPS